MLRAERHKRIEKALSQSSDESLLQLVSNSKIHDNGSGTACLSEGGDNIFVKLIPLSEIELKPENRNSTANYFHLPPYYNYRIGSGGFGAWRELDLHQRANQWVLSGYSKNFPLLHHWRVLPITQRGIDDKFTLKPWGDNEAIRQRVSAFECSTLSVVLFIEHFPHSLSQWIKTQWSSYTDPMELIRNVETRLDDIFSFWRKNNLLHMDAHFENIVTDGHNFCVCDYGLSLSTSFQLDDAEKNFFKSHYNFDRCTYLTSLIHAIVSQFDSRTPWRNRLQELVDGKHPNHVSDGVTTYLRKWKPLVLETGNFYDSLRTDINSPYPADRLQKIIERL